MFFSSGKFFILVQLTFLFICHAEENVGSDEKEVNWYPCDSDLKAESKAKDIKIFVPQCPPVNGTESRCPMVKGKEAILRIQFRPTMAVPSIERIIVARVPVAGKYVEMPYGPSVSPCENSSTIADDGSGCVDDGVVPDKLYTYTSFFKVLKSFPTVQNITTRIIVRQKFEDHKKLRLYRKHPGPFLVCATVPNIEVVEDESNNSSSK